MDAMPVSQSSPSRSSRVLAALVAALAAAGCGRAPAVPAVPADAPIGAAWERADLAVADLFVRPGGDELLAACPGRLVRLDFASGAILWEVPGRCRHATFPGDGSAVCTFTLGRGASAGVEVRTVDLADGRVRRAFSAPAAPRVWSVRAALPDGTLLAHAEVDGRDAAVRFRPGDAAAAALFDAGTRAALGVPAEAPGFDVLAVRGSVALLTLGGRLVRYDAATGTARRLSGPGGVRPHVDHAPDQDRLDLYCVYGPPLARVDLAAAFAPDAAPDAGANVGGGAGGRPVSVAVGAGGGAPLRNCGFLTAPGGLLVTASDRRSRRPPALHVTDLSGPAPRSAAAVPWRDRPITDLAPDAARRRFVTRDAGGRVAGWVVRPAAPAAGPPTVRPAAAPPPTADDPPRPARPPGPVLLPGQ